MTPTPSLLSFLLEWFYLCSRFGLHLSIDVTGASFRLEMPCEGECLRGSRTSNQFEKIQHRELYTKATEIRKQIKQRSLEDQVLFITHFILGMKDINNKSCKPGSSKIPAHHEGVKRIQSNPSGSTEGRLPFLPSSVRVSVAGCPHLTDIRISSLVQMRKQFHPRLNLISVLPVSFT